MSIIDRLGRLRPRGLPASAPAENVTIPDTSFRPTIAGIDTSARVHPTNPYRPPTGGDRFPTVTLHPQFVPPGLRPRMPGASPGLHLGHALAPGQTIRKGIAHPGRRLGRTGNPNVGVPGQKG